MLVRVGVYNGEDDVEGNGIEEFVGGVGCMIGGVWMIDGCGREAKLIGPLQEGERCPGTDSLKMTSLEK
jgi:hypothetical protein